MTPPVQNAFPPRKVDPDRFKSVVSMPEGSVKDPDYLRAIQDLEDQLPGRAGWLFAKGAFDKGDLLHLRDQEERQRYQEQELREKEALEFARLRERATSQAGSTAAKPATTAGPVQAARKKKALPVVAVKPARADQSKGIGDATTASLPAPEKPEPDAEQGPSPKRVRTGDESPPMVQGRPTEQPAEPGLADLLGAYGSESDSD